jgi:hypothetical protein
MVQYGKTVYSEFVLRYLTRMELKLLQLPPSKVCSGPDLKLHSPCCNCNIDIPFVPYSILNSNLGTHLLTTSITVTTMATYTSSEPNAHEYIQVPPPCQHCREESSHKTPTSYTSTMPAISDVPPFIYALFCVIVWAFSCVCILIFVWLGAFLLMMIYETPQGTPNQTPVRPWT